MLVCIGVLGVHSAGQGLDHLEIEDLEVVEHVHVMEHDRGLAGQDAEELDVVIAEGFRPFLGMQVEHADRLAFDEQGDGDEGLHVAACRGEVARIVGGVGDEDGLARGEGFAGHALAGLEEKLLGVFGQLAARGDDFEAGILFIPVHHRAAVALHELAGAVENRAAKLLSGNSSGMRYPMLLQGQEHG